MWRPYALACATTMAGCSFTNLNDLGQDASSDVGADSSPARDAAPDAITSDASAPPNIAYINSAAGFVDTGKATFIDATLSSLGANYALIVVVAWTGAPNAIVGISDTVSNVFVAAGAIQHGSGTGPLQQAFYYVQDTKGASADDVSVTFSVPVLMPDIRVAEYSGLTAFTGQVISAAGSSASPTLTIDAGAGTYLVVVGGASTVYFLAECPGFNVYLPSTDHRNLLADDVVTGPMSLTAVPPIASTAPWLLSAAFFQ